MADEICGKDWMGSQSRHVATAFDPPAPAVILHGLTTSPVRRVRGGGFQPPRQTFIFLISPVLGAVGILGMAVENRRHNLKKKG